MIVALLPSVYSRTDCGITCPARVALTESRKSGLDGSADSLANILAVPVAINLDRTTRNPALAVVWRANAPGRYSPTPPDVKLTLPDCAPDPSRTVTA